MSLQNKIKQLSVIVILNITKKKPDIDFEIEKHKCCSLPINKVFQQELNKGEDHSSAPNSTLAAIQIGKSWKSFQLI